MRLVVEFEGIVGVGEVLLGLLLYLRVCRNPVEKFGVVTRVFGVRHIVSLESFVVALFFFKGSFVATSKRPCQIIARNERAAFTTAPPTIIAILAMVSYIRVFFSNH